jgi:hypothetical protein
MIRRMDMGSTTIPMAILIKATGKMINSMGLVLKHV